MSPMSGNQQTLLGIQQALFQLSSMMQQATLTPQQIAQQQQQQREFEIRQSAVNSWANDQMSRMMAQQQSIAASFSSSVGGGFAGLEGALGGFMNQSFPPFNFGSFNSGFGGGFGGGVSSPLFGGPIQAPTFFTQRSSFGRF